MLTSVFVAGMYLHRQLFVGEDEFYKERNARAAFDAAPNPVGGKRSPSFAQSASPSWPEAKAHWSPVSQTSPIGSLAAAMLSKKGAKFREPQMRGTKTGVRREGDTLHGATAAEAKKRSSLPQSFLDAIDGGRIGEAQVAGRAKGVSRHNRDVLAFEQVPRERRGIAGAIDQMRGDIGKSVKGARRFGTGDAGNGTQAGQDAGAAPSVLGQHDGHGIHGSSQRGQGCVLGDGGGIRGATGFVP